MYRIIVIYKKKKKKEELNTFIEFIIVWIFNQNLSFQQAWNAFKIVGREL